jgi:anti-anti-sigma factor
MDGLANLAVLVDKMINARRPVTVQQMPERLSVEEGRQFFAEVKPALQEDRPRVVLDCSRMRQLDSAGIHVLLECLEEAMKRNGDVKLAAMPSATAAVLRVTQVDSLFEAFDSITEAVESFDHISTPILPEALQPGHSSLSHRA